MTFSGSPTPWNDAVRFTGAVEGAGHKGIVLHSIAEHHQLGTAEAALIRGALGQVLDGAAHQGHRVHIDARLRGAHIHTGAHQVGGRQRLRDGGDEFPVGLRHPLLHQGGESANKIDAGGLGGPVQSGGKGRVVLRLRGGSHQGDRGDGDPLVDDGDAELRLDGLSSGHQLFGISGDLVVDRIAGRLRVAAGAGQQGDPHSDGPHIQVLLVDHLDGLHNFVLTEHELPLLIVVT